jgi:protein SCO1
MHRPTPSLLRRALALALLGLLAACHRPADLPEVATLLPAPRPLPALTLTDTQAQPRTLARLAGRPTLLFIGFASCADLCPTTLTTLHSAAQALRDRPAAEQPQILFVSVDPLRDTPSVLGAYVRHFGDEIVGVSGDDATLRQLTSALGTTFERPADADPARGYAVQHSGRVYLLDRTGQLVAVFAPPHESAAIARDLRRIAVLLGEHS